MTEKESSKKDILATAMAYLNIKMRTCEQMRTYLSERTYKKGELTGEPMYTSDEIDATIETLISMKYLDDCEYARMYIAYGLSKDRGLSRIKRELSQKGISPDDIQSGIYAYEDENETSLADETKANAMELALKVAGDSPIDEKLLARIGRRLASKGYESDIIYSVLGQLRSRRD